MWSKVSHFPSKLVVFVEEYQGFDPCPLSQLSQQALSSPPTKLASNLHNPGIVHPTTSCLCEPSLSNTEALKGNAKNCKDLSDELSTVRFNHWSNEMSRLANISERNQETLFDFWPLRLYGSL